MATQQMVTERELGLAELTVYVRDYWQDHHNGLELIRIIVKSGGQIEFLPIRQWLTGKRVTASNEEILNAHKELLQKWAQDNPSISYLKIEYGGIDHPHHFHVSFEVFPVPPLPKESRADCIIPAGTIG